MISFYYRLLKRILFDRRRFGNRVRPAMRFLLPLIPHPSVRWQNGIRIKPVLIHRLWVARSAKRVHEPSLDSLLSLCLRPGDTVIDVGAQIGITVTMAAVRVGEGGKVHAFEPNADNYAVLNACLKENHLSNVVCNQIAVGAESGSATFAEEAFSGFIQRADPQEKGVEVPTTTLDHYVKDAGIGKVDFVKIDVDGPDFSVLLGAEGLISRDDAPFVSIECSRYWQRFGAELADAHRFLVDKGYCVAVAHLDKREVHWLRDPTELPPGWGIEKGKAVNLYAFKRGVHDQVVNKLGLEGPWPGANPRS